MGMKELPHSMSHLVQDWLSIWAVVLGCRVTLPALLERVQDTKG